MKEVNSKNNSNQRNHQWGKGEREKEGGGGGGRNLNNASLNPHPPISTHALYPIARPLIRKRGSFYVYNLLHTHHLDNKKRKLTHLMISP